MPSGSFVADLIVGMGKAFAPLIEAFESAEGVAAFLSDYGWLLDITQGITSIKEPFGQVVTDGEQLLSDLEKFASATSVADALKIVPTITEDLQSLSGYIVALKGISIGPNWPAPLNDPHFWEAFPDEVIQRLIFRYLNENVPWLFGPLRFLGVLSSVDKVESTTRPAHTQVNVDWSKLTAFLSHPEQLLSNVYGWAGTFDWLSYLGAFGDLVLSFPLAGGLVEPERLLLDRYYDPASTYRQQVVEWRTTLFWIADFSSKTAAVLDVDVAALPIPPANNTVAAPDGFVLLPEVVGKFTETVNISTETTLTISGNFATEAVRLEVHPKSIQIARDSTATPLDAKLTLACAPVESWVIGDVDSTCLKIEKAHISVAAQGEASDPKNFEYRVEAGIDAAKISVDLGQGDGFLQQMLGSTPQKTDFALTFQWSSLSGFGIKGQGPLAGVFPLHQSMAGVLTVETFALGLQPPANGEGLALAAGLTGKLTLGPLSVTVSNLGLLLIFSTSPSGNLGSLDFQFGFKSPDGLDISIDAGVVAGGGYLFCDQQKGRYAGAIQLELESMSLAAIGLLSTKLPDGSPIKNSDGTPGFSLLIIITASFAPFQIGFGFALDGLGGLLGLDRTMNVDALRAGVRNRAIDAELMPTDPLDNASQLVTSLGNLFPIAMGRFLIGPMAQLTWGTPPLMVFDLAVLIEVPPPLKVAIVGRIRAALPEDNSSAIVLIHLDVLGVIDLDKGTISIDATIYDSTIAGFALSGDMALRAAWKNNPQFAVAVGGFHPCYQPPPGFPSLRRLTLSLCSGDNPRLRFETYLAVTSNTVQCGARVDLHAESSGFAIDGLLAFDTLIHLNPFGLVVDFAGGVAVTYQGSVICAVSLAVHLTGPGPWRVCGKATVSILFISGSVTFNAVLGQGAPPPVPAAVDVGALLTQAITTTANWTAQPLPGEGFISLRSAPNDGTIRAHPLAALTFRQRTVPFGVVLDKYGDAPVSGVSEFTVTGVVLGSSQKTTLVSVTDEFAPGQFQNLTDADELSRPSFEPFQSGFTVSFDTSDLDDESEGDAAPLTYEVIVVDSVPVSPVPAVTIAAATALRTATFSPSALAPNRHVGTRRFAGPSFNIQVLDPQYAAADATDIGKVSVLRKASSWTEAAQMVRSAATSGQKLQVVRI